MMDIVERLLEPFSHKPNYGFKVESMEAHEATCREAATKIETLRAALQFYAAGIGHTEAEDNGAIARIALGEPT